MSRTIEELKGAHKAYMLRTCDKEMQGASKRLKEGRSIDATPFQWPKEGPVSADDWDSRPVCGGGLHGLLWGAGSSNLLNWDSEALWLVVGVDEWIEIDEEKVKVPSGDVVFCGNMRGASDLLVALGADPGKCIGSVATAGHGGCISIWYYHQKRERYCLRIGYIGEDGLVAGQLYRIEGDKFIPVIHPKEVFP